MIVELTSIYQKGRGGGDGVYLRFERFNENAEKIAEETRSSQNLRAGGKRDHEPCVLSLRLYGLCVE
jgi:hypothetical protein